MDQPEERVRSGPRSHTSLRREQQNQTEARRLKKQTPDSPVLSCVSFKSGQSKYDIIDFKVPSADHMIQKQIQEQSCLSSKTGQSMHDVFDFKGPNPDPDLTQQRQNSLEPSCLSLKSDQSKHDVIDFKGRCPSSNQIANQENLVPTGSSSLDRIFTRLKENVFIFVEKELKVMQKLTCQDHLGCLESQKEAEEALKGEDEEKRRSIQAFQKIALHFLRGMKQEALADRLQRRLPVFFQYRLKAKLKRKFQCVFEGIAKAGSPTLLNQIYTELYIVEGGTGEVNDQHEISQIEAASKKTPRAETAIRQEDIFRAPPGRDQPIRTVMTKGVAGIGKTVLTQKFTLDWAEEKTNQDIQFIFPFSFRELNVLKKKRLSLVEMVSLFFPGAEEAGICISEDFQGVFIFDGLDECRLSLDFHNNEILTDVTESTSVDVLLTNLIWGTLLPSTRLWITTRPAAGSLVPAECVDMVTEVRGFTDRQKDEYFKKRFTDEQHALRIISHVKKSRSLHIMCHIPVFCWITSTVLEHMLRDSVGGELPKTLTEMYIYFLVVQSKVRMVKYCGGSGTDPHWSQDSCKMVESLGKLALDQLQKGNLIFYQSDLTDCGIDMGAASMYSGVFTQIFKEERGLYQEKVFCFVHQSVQEFLAALHVHLTFINSGVNLLRERESVSWWYRLFSKPNLNSLHQSALDKALQSPNGRLDLFLRFLLGLSLQANQTLLQGLQVRFSSQTNQETVTCIKTKISENLTSETSINLFHCLNELKDRSLMEEIEQYLNSEGLSTDKLSPALWSALVFILLSSDKDLDVFVLRKYSASEEALLRLLPVVKASNKAQLSQCGLSDRACTALSSVLKSKSFSLTDLDLSNNDLWDSGVKLLCAGLQSSDCRLKVLRLSGCLITKEGFAHLDTALNCNPLHLRELDLSYNHPGDSGLRLMLTGVEDPHWALETVMVEPHGEEFLIPGLKKYFCELSLDTNTASTEIKLSDDNRTAMYVETDHLYPEHPDRFDYWPQLLCSDCLTGRCYWEVVWKGEVLISLSTRSIRRKGDSNECLLGRNNQSWTLICSGDSDFSVCHNGRVSSISSSSSSSFSSSLTNRVAVYLDYPAGSLCFYRVSSYTLIHLHTFKSTFTEPLYPGFGFWSSSGWFGSSVRLCSLKEAEVT